MRLGPKTAFLLALVVVGGCGGKGWPIQPDPPSAEVRMTCHAPIVRHATSAEGTDVHFDAPVPTSGTAPFDVQCEPGSSSVFPIGETPVRCNAKAADKGQASCTFPVTVRTSHSIAKTKFMAFGDSITAGTISLAPLIMLDTPETYPFKLEAMLRERYVGQSITVTNHGKGSDQTNQGVLRLPSELDAERPEVLLLLEGINAILSISTARQEGYLRTMITDAKKRNVEVIIATVMPVAPNGRFQPASEYMAAIRALNTRIISLSVEQKIGNVVDLFGLFEANMKLLGVDGVHPTIEGQTEIARAFRDEIVPRYDNRSAPSLRPFTSRRTR